MYTIILRDKKTGLEISRDYDLKNFDMMEVGENILDMKKTLDESLNNKIPF